MNAPRWLREWLLCRRINALVREARDARNNGMPAVDRLELWAQIDDLQSQRAVLQARR